MADVSQGKVGETHLVNGELWLEDGEQVLIFQGQGKATTSGDNAVVAAIASTILRVLSYTIQAHGTVTAVFQDTTSTTALGPEFDLEAREGVHAVAAPGAFLFETASGKGIDLNLSATIDVAWHVVYVKET